MYFIRILLLLCSINLLAQEKEVSAIFVGDSLTQGGSTHHTYRHFIDKCSKVKLKHTGPFKDKKNLLHAGRGGWSVQKISNHFEPWYKSSKADLLILHANHNNFSFKKPIPAIIKAQEKIIRTAHKVNPKVKVIFASSIPSVKLPKYSYLKPLAKEQFKLFERLKKDKVNIWFANPGKGFDTNWLIKDGVHLKAQGAEHMAKCFAIIINSIYLK